MVQTEETLVTSIAPVNRVEAEQLSNEMADTMVALLEQLTPEQWDTQTECELWRVRDMTAHLLGWSEALSSFKEMGTQSVGALRRRKELGNIVDAQNQVQVDARRNTSSEELIARIKTSAPKAARRRSSTSRSVGWIPFYMPYMGGWITLSYLTDEIFPRDWFMHRIDISRAIGLPFTAGPADQRMLNDIVRDWFERSEAEARLQLEGEIGGTYVSKAAPRATLTADSLEFIRMLFGRTDRSVVGVEGDGAAAQLWLDTFFPV